MIVTAVAGDRLEIITQIDHARFAAELLGLWIADGLPEHVRRQDFLFAVREHDNGWRERDSAPMLDPRQGDRPYDFVSMPPEIRSELWWVGCQRYRTDNAYAALLIVEHARRLHADRQKKAYEELLSRLGGLRSELMEATGMHEDLLQVDYAFLELADLISLVVCSDWRETRRSRGMTIEQSKGNLKLDPFPLAGRTTFRIPHRSIARRAYRDSVDLAGELATARWHWREVRVGS